jgi:hypothetical protein
MGGTVMRVFFLRFAAVASIPLAALAISVPMVLAQVHPAKPVNLPIPQDDNDLKNIIALAGQLKTQATQCRTCKNNGGSAECGPAVTVANDADVLRVDLYGMLDLTQRPAADIVANMATVQANYDTLADHVDTQRRGLAWSKFLSDSAKITLDVISLNESLASIKTEFNGTSTAVPGVKNLFVAPTPAENQTLSDILRQTDTVVEAANGITGAANDLKSAHVNDQGFLSQNVSRALTVKGGVSDIAGAVRNYQAAVKLAEETQAMVKAAKTAGDLSQATARLASASKAASDMRKGVLNVIAKVGGELADYSQAQLAKDIENNENELAASDKVLQQGLADLRRIKQRQAMIQRAIDAMGQAAAMANGCAAGCNGAQPLRFIPKSGSTSGSYGMDLKNANINIAIQSRKLSGQTGASLCKEKKDAGKTATGGPKTDCKPGHDLTSMMENVACQEQHAGH